MSKKGNFPYCPRKKKSHNVPNGLDNVPVLKSGNLVMSQMALIMSQDLRIAGMVQKVFRVPGRGINRIDIETWKRPTT